MKNFSQNGIWGNYLRGDTNKKSLSGNLTTLQILFLFNPSVAGFAGWWQPVTLIDVDDARILYCATARTDFFICSSRFVVGSRLYRFSHNSTPFQIVLKLELQ